MSVETTQNNEKQPEKDKEKKKLVNFLLSNDIIALMDELADKYTSNRTQFIYRAVNILNQNQELLAGKKLKPSEHTVSKDDFKEFEGRIEEKMLNLQKDIRTLALASQSIINHEESMDKKDKLKAMEKLLLDFKGLPKLDDYDKVQGYLVQQYPDWESDITVNKIYYDLIISLMQRGLVSYDPHDKKLIWSVKYE